ncbi:MAG: DUF1565 domain-containing protein, partial [Kiritimatiellae bacterium]|nr:DUF1565 domain-containing protein [Kiritimatiellia bacterium]
MSLTGGVVSNNEANCGGGLYNGGASACTIVNNRAAQQGGGAYMAGLTNCIVAHNQAPRDGGWYGGTYGGWYNTFTMNQSEEVCSASPTWGTKNTLVWGETVDGRVTGKLVPCPMVDPWNGDYRLLAGSGAVDVGGGTSIQKDLAGNARWQGAGSDLGALEADANNGNGVVEGWRRIMVFVEGSGQTDVGNATTETGGSVTVTALDGGRPFVGWKWNGEVISTEQMFTFENVTEHGVLTAVFGPGDIWVDATRGNDANTGSEALPLKTLQAAVRMACDGDTVRVKPGTYDRFAVKGKGIEIVGEAGADATIIDARWQGRCAMLGNPDSSSETNPIARLKGFTLRRGCSATETSKSGEGAACLKGRLEDCIVENCGTRNGSSYTDSSVLYDAETTRCIVRDCRASKLHYCWTSWMTNQNTLITGNDAGTLWCGSSYVVNRHLTLAGNAASKKALEGGTWMNCIVWGNGTTNTSGWAGGWNCIEGETSREATEEAGPIWADDPEFVDAEHGDFRLTAPSPYVDAGSGEWTEEGETDLAGNARIAGAAVDLGCYEGEIVPCAIEFRLGEGLVQLDNRPLSRVIGQGEDALAPDVAAVSGWRFEGWTPSLEGVTEDTAFLGETIDVPCDWTAEIHRGRIEADTTWAAGPVHVVEGAVTVASGRTLTIAAGAVVKFSPGAKLVREDGGMIVSEGATFTHLFDDEAG